MSQNNEATIEIYVDGELLIEKFFNRRRDANRFIEKFKERRKPEISKRVYEIIMTTTAEKNGKNGEGTFIEINGKFFYFPSQSEAGRSIGLDKRRVGEKCKLDEYINRAYERIHGNENI